MSMPDPFEGIDLDKPPAPKEVLPGDQSLAAQLSTDGLPNAVMCVPLQPVAERRAAAYVTAAFAALHPGEQVQALSHMRRYKSTVREEFHPFYIRFLENMLGFTRRQKLELICQGYKALSHVTKNKVLLDCSAMAAEDASIMTRYCQSTKYQDLVTANAIALFLSEAMFLADLLKIEPVVDDLFKVVHPAHLLLEWLKREDRACEPWKVTMLQPKEKPVTGICAHTETIHISLPQYVETTAMFSRMLGLGTPPASQPLAMLSGPQPVTLLRLPPNFNLPAENKLKALFSGAVIKPELVPEGGLPARYDANVIAHLPEEELPPTSRPVVDLGARPKVRSETSTTVPIKYAEVEPLEALMEILPDVTDIYDRLHNDEMFPQDHFRLPPEPPKLVGVTLEEAAMNDLDIAVEYGLYEQLIEDEDIRLDAADKLHKLLERDMPLARVVTMDDSGQHWIEVLSFDLLLVDDTYICFTCSVAGALLPLSDCHQQEVASGLSPSGYTRSHGLVLSGQS